MRSSSGSAYGFLSPVQLNPTPGLGLGLGLGLGAGWSGGISIRLTRRDGTGWDGMDFWKGEKRGLFFRGDAGIVE